MSMDHLSICSSCCDLCWGGGGNWRILDLGSFVCVMLDLLEGVDIESLDVEMIYISVHIQNKCFLIC